VCVRVCVCVCVFVLTPFFVIHPRGAAGTVSELHHAGVCVYVCACVCLCIHLFSHSSERGAKHCLRITPCRCVCVCLCVCVYACVCVCVIVHKPFYVIHLRGAAGTV